MQPAQWSQIVTDINGWAGQPLDAAAAARAFRDLADVPVEQVADAVAAWRLLHGEAVAPDGPGLRKLWAERTFPLPERDAAVEEIRATYRRHREESGETLGYPAALAELSERAPVLGQVCKVWGGPPPYNAEQLRDRWQPLLRAACERERRRLLLRQLPAASHSPAVHVAAAA
jgi:hypothetical protein